MCEIHRLTTNTCLTQVLIFKYHKVMNKIPLSGFCLLLKSRHKHLFRIMRITYMLLFAAIFCLHAENAISQKITLQGDNLSLKDYLNTIEKQTDYLFIYDAGVNVNKGYPLIWSVSPSRKFWITSLPVRTELFPKRFLYCPVEL